METSPLDELLADALKQCAQDFPQAKQKLDAFNEALDRLEERDGHENLTRAAHDARQYLRSGLLDMRPYKRAKKEVGKQLRKAKARYEKSTATALAHKVVYHQWKIEYELLDDRDDGIKLVPRSREEHAQDSIARIAAPFVHAMIERGVTPSAISRGRASEADVIAQLIQSAYDDPQYEDPANPWVAIHRAGVFDAYRTGLTEERGARLALLLLAAFPIQKSSRASVIRSEIASMSDEEVYYWYAKAVGGEEESLGQLRGNALKALRILLAGE